MASNTVKQKVLVGNQKQGLAGLLIRFFKGQTTTDAGSWVKMAGADYAKFQIRGITTGTLQIWGINPDVTDEGEQEVLPTDETGAIQMGSNITADGIVEFEGKELMAYMKVKITVATSIDLDVIANVKRSGKAL
jgi:hypothetical protein